MAAQYSSVMVKAVQAGQVWRSDENGDNFLVTKVYGELFTQYAMLRPAKVSAPESETIRVKISKMEAGVTLPGYTFTQESQDF
jgi:CYTH domain-containing protein